MGSSGKTRTTFAKLSRESKLRDKRADKEARKAARKLDAASAPGDIGDTPEGLHLASPGPDGEASGSGVSEPRPDGV